MERGQEWERLARAIERRRLDLRLRPGQLSDRAGFSRNTLRQMLKRQSADPLTLRKLDHGLQWTPGSSERVLQGGEPETVEDAGWEPNWPPVELPAEIIQRYLPDPDEVFDHPEDIEAWGIRGLRKDERRWLIAYRRALRAGERGQGENSATGG